MLFKVMHFQLFSGIIHGE